MQILYTIAAYLDIVSLSAFDWDLGLIPDDRTPFLGGLLLYYEAATITEASAAPGGGLTAPRQILDLRKGNVTWACPAASDADAADGNTKFMLVLDHGDRQVMRLLFAGLRS